MTDADQPPLPLASEFPPASREQWLKLVERVLKGASFEKLVSHTYDGLPIEPLYPRDAQAVPVAGRTPGAPRQVMQRIDLPDVAAANAQALHELENGANGLSLVFAGAIGAYGYGIDASEMGLGRVLDNVQLDAGIALELDLSPEAKEAASGIVSLLEHRGISPAAVNIRFGFDPIGALAVRGRGPTPWRDIAPGFAALIADLAGRGFRGPFAVADTRSIHAAGGSEAQELGYALAVAAAYLRALEGGGIPLDAARGMIFFRFAADADQFLTMAKFRALRLLWARVEEACGLMPQPAFVSAETAWRMMTRRDPWVNMLRTTVAAFSAGLGGADAVAVLPFTAALGLPDAFARRIARNTQLILLEEANLAKVADPVAGSGAVEDLTHKLCAAAWSLFQEIEAAGGAAEALERGAIQNKVADVRARRQAAVARRTDALTGVSEFPLLTETSVSILDTTTQDASSAGNATASPPPLRGRHREGGTSDASAQDTTPLPNPPPQGGREQTAAGGNDFGPLLPIRLAEPYERLRDASDRVLAKTGARPKVFLVPLGHPSDFATRASFARNLFEAGGIEAATPDGFVNSALSAAEATADVAALAAAFKASGAKLACVCSSDAIYVREGAAAGALSAAGARHIYLAGPPGEQEATLRAAGIGTFVYAGCDVLATLQAAHDMIG